MADLYFTHCNGCHQMTDCLPHEDEFLCVDDDAGGGDGVGCYHRITAAQDALRRKRVCIKGNYEPDCRGSCIDIRCSCNK